MIRIAGAVMVGVVAIGALTACDNKEPREGASVTMVR